MGYACSMSTKCLLQTLKAEQSILETLQRRRRRNTELRSLSSGGAIVFAGLLLAAIYGLLTHQIPL